MRLGIVSACLSLCLIGFSTANDAHASIRKETNIPAEGLGPALNALAKDRNFQIVYVTEEIANVHTEGAVGEFTTDEALKRLLTGTGLTFHYLDDKTVTIGSADTQHQRSDRTSQTTSSGSSDDANTSKEGKKSSSGDFRVAQLDQGANPRSSTVGTNASVSQDGAKKVELTEIIVTAQKRNERLQDVPVPVTAIGADALLESNQLRLQDYFTMIPGFSVTPYPSLVNQQILAIRGITTGLGSDPTVGITIDDVPYGSSTANGGGNNVPDIDPSDLARVEVLRGPQGTLYGASSMGGLLKYVTVDPSTDEVSGSVQVGGSSVYNGAELGYSVRGAVNVPVSDTIALRASAFVRQDPGYIDNPVLGIDGVNKSEAYGGHLSALWRPSEIFSLKLSALVQHSKEDGSSEVEVAPGLGNLQQDFIRGVGAGYMTVQAYSATLKAKLGIADLTALSGYNITRDQNSLDYTNYNGAGALVQFGFPPLVNGFGVGGAAVVGKDRSNKFTQEIRISAPIGPRIDWLVGVFYAHDNSPPFSQLLALDPATGVTVGSAINFVGQLTSTEYAAFTDLTWHISDRFDVQIGGRESQIRQNASETDTGPFVILFDGSPSPYVYPTINTKVNPFTYLLTPRFKVTPDLMVYARLASGYRPGGPNGVPGTPIQYSPDKTKNYEIGIKGDTLERKLSFDASVYYIDWKNLQIFLTSPSGLMYTGNGSRAKSQGVELSVESRPISGLTLSAWVAWSDAVLTDDFPSTSSAYGVNGDRLPLSSRFSGNVSMTDEFHLASQLRGFVGGTVSYVGDREGTFTASPERQNFAAYAQTNLRTGLKYESWTYSLFVNNAFDKRALVGGGLGSVPENAFGYIQPRTIGMSLTKTF